MKTKIILEFTVESGGYSSEDLVAYVREIITEDYWRDNNCSYLATIDKLETRSLEQ